MIGLDTSFLVGLTIREHPSHRRCRALFDNEIVGREGSAALAAQVLSEFPHIVTDPRRFARPLAMQDALDICSQWWHASECRPVCPSPESVSVYLRWMEQHRLGRKRLLDTMLAACYHCAGVTRLATTDWRDFQLFGVFEIKAL